MRLDGIPHSSASLYGLKVRYLKARTRLLSALGGGVEASLREIRARKKAVYGGLAQQRGRFRLLDVGAGMGGDRIPQKYGAWCVRAEPSSALVVTAQQRDPQRPHIRGVAARLPFTAGSFDVAQAEYVFHHIDRHEQRASLDEMLRVARDHVVILDSCAPSAWLLKVLMRAYWYLTDGGALYRTRGEWEAFLQTTGVPFEAFYGRRLCRSCLFVLTRPRG